jgi:hypothetical protein
MSSKYVQYCCRCSVDPYLFENFNTVDGDFLSAKFRAFKFPESTYVQFKGTVNVCLDKCRGVSSSRITKDKHIHILLMAVSIAVPVHICDL